ncbi:putative replicative DNA helicase [Selenomonas ruminantium subsp. lactilytica TAM6421]|uniref:Replicative DNA helicase n=1 Tax=Selenomonas ruminantium subsp. lactilytica (strain NBRC 103574 / TAM6421) TaxID=927704 RepID=I0GS14_SELRL|nr:replicative DNA helicase [Selenomonas ruminantium]BAL83551.1 putative replicative DNA helicase [Selenomonas ruminantium subsp. lactilytica TAM6421]
MVKAKISDLKNSEAETGLLCSMMMKQDIIYDVSSTLKAEDFYSAQNQIIFKNLVAMSVKRQPIDLVTVVEQLRNSGDLEKVGGIMAITQIFNAVATSARYAEYADIVLKYSKRRQAVALSEEIARVACDVTQDFDSEDFMRKVAELAMNKQTTIKGFDEELVDFMAELDKRRIEKFSGILSGYDQLDSMTGGWKPSQLIILAARPSMGKSALALNFAVNAGMAGKSVAMFSLEMPKFDLISRMIAFEKNVRLAHLQTPQLLSEDDFTRIILASEKLSKCNIHMFDENVATPTDVISRCKAVQAKNGLDLVIIDYLQLMTAGGRYGDNRVQEVSYISRQLKMMAQNMGIPVIALSQLSRSLESRNDKRPQLSDLRESGSIEQDADKVMMLYREAYYDRESDDTSTELIVMKNRNGELGTVMLDFFGEFTKFISAPNNVVPSSQIPT